MARKKAEAGQISKADAVRAALKEGYEKPEGVAFIKDRYGIDMHNQMFSSYKSQEKARAAKKGAEPEGGSSTAGRPAGRGGSSVNNGKAAELARAVKQLIELYGA